VIGAGSYVGYCLVIVLSSALTPRWGPRRVAVLAGVMATAGTATVALAPSALVLATGILIAGASTGIASPPLAAAVSRWVREDSQPRAQTLVNAGTGVGVLVSGPVALLLLERWRLAWAMFAACAAVVTWWIHVTVPRGSDGPVPTGAREGRSSAPPHRATGTLVVGSFLVGLSSVAIWTFGRDLITVEGNASNLLASVMWIVIGAAGIGGALSGPLVQRIGIPASWMMLMVALAAASAGLAAAPSNTWLVAAAAAVFGASYIALTGVALLWATRLYPRRAAFGVGMSFFVIAAGQAIGASLAGAGIDRFGLPPVFYACAAVAVLGAALAPIIRASPES
jgi:predicted MFS family arabinose efflux permease